MITQTLKIFTLLILLSVSLLSLMNLSSLPDGIRYLGNVVAYGREPIEPIDPQGRYGSCYTLVRQGNAEREASIRDFLAERNVAYQPIPISGSSQADWLVRLSPAGPFTVFSTHYDKLFDGPGYQGASDNTAAICVLLAAVDALYTREPGRPVAFLFTGEEEKGLRGAQAFVDFARDTGLPIRQIINFDNLGRGGLGVRPSAEAAGFYFVVPFWGETVFDGRDFAPARPYRPANPQVVADLQTAMPVTVFTRMVATSDANVFEAAGYPTVTVSGDDMHYLNLTWHTYDDRIELLDERNLRQAFGLILSLALHQPKM